MNSRITFNPKQCGGRPCIRGMRIRVKDVLEMLASGATPEEILQSYPYLEQEDIRACLEYAAAQIEKQNAGIRDLIVVSRTLVDSQLKVTEQIGQLTEKIDKLTRGRGPNGQL